MKIKLLVLAVFLSTANAISQPLKHDDFDKLLKTFVSNDGHVNYKGLLKSGKQQLDIYIKSLERNEELPRWSREEQMVYWINAYNAFTIKAILDHYPVKRIIDIKPKAAENVWKVRVLVYRNVTLSLDDIEHTILRKEFNDPRIHFAINCASVSCPVLRNEAYAAAKLVQQLEEQTSIYINDSKHNRISTHEVYLSELFNWFKADFEKKGSLIDFINQYSKTKIDTNASVKYLDYNWDLNE